MIEQKKRNQIPEEFKWRRDHLFSQVSHWWESFDQVNQEADNFFKYRGTLHDAPMLKECFSTRDSMCQRAEKLYVYANMYLHEDTENPEAQSLADKADSLSIKLNSAMSFIDPEILGLSKDQIDAFLALDDVYKHYMDNMLRVKEHILSPELEELLAQAGEIGMAAENIFSMLNNADMRFGIVKDESGNDVTITHGRFLSLMESSNADVRRNTFKTFYESYFKQKNTLAATYNASVRKDVFFTKSRKYSSSLAWGLHGANIPATVYTNLIQTVNEYLPAMHQYIRLRGKMLGVAELHMYDLYTPLVPEARTAVSYDEAKETVLAALSVMGDDYINTVKKAFAEGWFDVYENKGKRSGAYAWGAYGVHPYVLLNYDNKINDMFTLAHEIGHAMHSHYTWATQPYVYGDYTIFAAEVSSTVNEALLMEYLLKNTADTSRKRYLINYFLDQFRGTVFRQTMFAEFEMKTHEMAESGQPLTVESLCQLYRELNLRYYGQDIVMDEEIDIEWARIPHFYSPYYVYQYATGFSAAIALSRKILADSAAVGQYIEFLKSGSSDYSIPLLKKAGVDMSMPEPIQNALELFQELLNQFNL